MTYFSAASCAGAIVTFCGGALPLPTLLAIFTMATRKASGAHLYVIGESATVGGKRLDKTTSNDGVKQDIWEAP